MDTTDRVLMLLVYKRVDEARAMAEANELHALLDFIRRHYD